TRHRGTKRAASTWRAFIDKRISLSRPKEGKDGSSSTSSFGRTSRTSPDDSSHLAAPLSYASLETACCLAVIRSGCQNWPRSRHPDLPPGRAYRSYLASTDWKTQANCSPSMDDSQSTDGAHQNSIQRGDTELPLSSRSLKTRPSHRLQRPRRVQTQTPDEQEYTEPQPNDAPKIKRQASKGRLLAMFGRSKSTKGGEAPASHTASDKAEDIPQSREDHAATANMESSQDIEVIAAELELHESATQNQPPQKPSRSKSSKPKASSKKTIPWDPPPLFQAYPQSVKYATLPSPAISADTLLRNLNDKRRKPKKKAQNSGKQMGSEAEEEGRQGDTDVDLSLGQWSDKIYLLVTSGYMLQYAGHGSFDRLPEKIMPIGKESAAFASDAIPGKHWVLQISHVLEENGSAKIDTSFSFPKKLGFGSSMKRCSASNFLLVLDNPAELDAWLSAVRREIESWGGKKCHSDTAPAQDERHGRTLQQKPSRQFLVKRDPHQFSNSSKGLTSASGETIMDSMPLSTSRKMSTATQDSGQSRSMSHTAVSPHQEVADGSRISPQTSYISTNIKTLSTSRDASPAALPRKSTVHAQNEISSRDRKESSDGSAMATASTCSSPLSPQPHEYQAMSPPSWASPKVRNSPNQTPSGGTPNFSVPNFCKRYSSAQSTPPLSTASSSNASNLPRKPASPATISEHADPPLDFAFAVNEALSDVPAATTTSPLERPKPSTPESRLQTPTSERAAPRRFSSLEYSRGVSPGSLRSSLSPSPHPPPTSALPALPEAGHSKASLSPRTLRRPVSMVVRPSAPPQSSPHPPPSIPYISSPSADDNDPMIPPPSRAPPPPPPCEPDPSDTNSLHPPAKIMNRRSMPQLIQPPSDPPNGPLPTPPVPRLPPIKLSSGSLRRSVERPLRAGFGSRSPGLVEGTES
ncbi:MAG: hypothetical protein Q9174_003906, partial [Haloplaca sp. 1 TL-2023]